jgi:hypothetical protein
MLDINDICERAAKRIADKLGIPVELVIKEMERYAEKHSEYLLHGDPTQPEPAGLVRGRSQRFKPSLQNRKT